MIKLQEICMLKSEIDDVAIKSREWSSKELGSGIWSMIFMMLVGKSINYHNGHITNSWLAGFKHAFLFFNPTTGIMIQSDYQVRIWRGSHATRPNTPILMMKNVRGCFQQFLRTPSTPFEQTHMGSSDWKWPMSANGRPWSSHRCDCGRAAFLRPWAGWQSQVLGQGRGLMALDLGVAVNGSRLRFFQCFWYFGVERVRSRLSYMSFLSQWMFKPWQLKTRG